MEPILKEVDPAEAQARASSEEPDEEEDEIMNNDIEFYETNAGSYSSHP